MKYFVRYYLWTVAILVMNYSYAFFGSINKTVKGVDNIFMLIFPNVIIGLIIRNYSFVKELTYVRKFGILISYVFFVFLIIYLLKKWNPAEMQMNEKEKNYGDFGITLFYCIILLVLGAITITIVKPRQLKERG